MVIDDHLLRCILTGERPPDLGGLAPEGHHRALAISAVLVTRRPRRRGQALRSGHCPSGRSAGLIACPTHRPS